MSQTSAIISYRPCQSSDIQFYETNLSCFSNKLLVVTMECGEEEWGGEQKGEINYAEINPPRLQQALTQCLASSFLSLPTSSHQQTSCLRGPPRSCLLMLLPSPPNPVYWMYGPRLGYAAQGLALNFCPPCNAILSLWITTKACPLSSRAASSWNTSQTWISFNNVSKMLWVEPGYYRNTWCWAFSSFFTLTLDWLCQAQKRERRSLALYPNAINK